MMIIIIMIIMIMIKRRSAGWLAASLAGRLAGWPGCLAGRQPGRSDIVMTLRLSII